MKNRIHGLLRALLVIFCLVAATAHAAKWNYRIGEAAPDFQLTTLDGKTIALADYKGKIVVLEWTNHDCPYVRKHYESGNMQALQKEAVGQGVIWFTIISSSPGTQGHVNASQARTLRPSAILVSLHVVPVGRGPADRPSSLPQRALRRCPPFGRGGITLRIVAFSSGAGSAASMSIVVSRVVWAIPPPSSSPASCSRWHR